VIVVVGILLIMLLVWGIRRLIRKVRKRARARAEARARARAEAQARAAAHVTVPDRADAQSTQYSPL